MPKLKKTIKKVEKKVVPEVEVSTTLPSVEIKIETDGTKVMPIWENKQVVEVLDDGKETETHFHCKLSDGTTAHVPKKLFI